MLNISSGISSSSKKITTVTTTFLKWFEIEAGRWWRRRDGYKEFVLWSVFVYTLLYSIYKNNIQWFELYRIDQNICYHETSCNNLYLRWFDEWRGRSGGAVITPSSHNITAATITPDDVTDIDCWHRVLSWLASRRLIVHCFKTSAPLPGHCFSPHMSWCISHRQLLFHQILLTVVKLNCR